jgi:hypothetical protein
MSDYTLIVQPAPVITATVQVTQGPAGGGGGGGSAYQHTQNSASATWTVNHNLGYRPNVALTTLGGLLMLAEVLHINTNQVQVVFDNPTTGLALCS